MHSTFNNKIKVTLQAMVIINILCFMLNAGAIPANAKELSLSINPPIIEIKAIPPTTVISQINIQNKSDAQVSLSIEFKSFKPKGENGEIIYSKEALEIFKNIQIMDADMPIDSLILGPKQQKNLNLTITVPQDTSISDYYFSVIFVSTDFPQIESNSSTNQLGIATNVLLSIGPLEIPKAVLEKFSSDIFLEKGPVPFMIRIKNDGTHFIKPKGEINIKNMFGQSVGKLNLVSANILSGSTRAIPNDIYMQALKTSNPITKDDNSLSFKNPIALWKENFLLGLYTATLNISMSDEGPIFTKTINFFAFPFQILIAIIVIVIAAIVIANRLKIYMNKNRT